MKTEPIGPVDQEIGAAPEGTAGIKVQAKTATGWRMLVRERADGVGQTLFLPGDLPLESVSAFAGFCASSWGPGVYRVQFYRSQQGRMVLGATGREVHVSKTSKRRIPDEAPTKPAAPHAMADERERRLAAKEEKIEAMREAMFTRQLEIEREGSRTLLEMVMARINAPPVAQVGPSEAEVQMRIQLAELRAEQKANTEAQRTIAALMAQQRRARASADDGQDDDDDDDEPDIWERLVGRDFAPIAREAGPGLLRQMIEKFMPGVPKLPDGTA